MVSDDKDDESLLVRSLKSIMKFIERQTIGGMLATVLAC
jgi:hypothetical protein